MAAPGNLSSSPRYCKLPIERPGLALADAGRLKECKAMAAADSKYCLEALELNPITNFMLGWWVETSHFIAAAPLQRMADANSKYCLEALELHPVTSFMLG